MSDMLRCPVCASATAVINSRPHIDHNGSHAAYRRRKCTGCQHRFSTLEFVVEKFGRRLADPVQRDAMREIAHRINAAADLLKEVL